MYDLRGCLYIADHAIDAILLGLEMVIAQLEPDIEEYKKTSGHTDGETGDIKKGKCLVLPKMAEGSLQIVP
jgi:hypothetical protein